MTRETPGRSWVKSLAWRLLGLVILWLVAVAFGAGASQATWIALVFHGVRFVLYYFHERAWGRVGWGLEVQPGAIVWFTGLSGSGKSTIAEALQERIARRRWPVQLLDGDVIRRGLCRGLGFTPEGRHENLRRVREAAKLLRDCGAVAIAACITPYESDRRDVQAEQRALLVHVATPLDVCEGRDPKGLWRRARAGEIPNFTGVGDPFEEPLSPDLRFSGRLESPQDAARRIEAELLRRGWL